MMNLADVIIDSGILAPLWIRKPVLCLSMYLWAMGSSHQA